MFFYIIVALISFKTVSQHRKWLRSPKNIDEKNKLLSVELISYELLNPSKTKIQKNSSKILIDANIILYVIN